MHGFHEGSRDNLGLLIINDEFAPPHTQEAVPIVNMVTGDTPQKQDDDGNPSISSMQGANKDKDKHAIVVIGRTAAHCLTS